MVRTRARWLAAVVCAVVVAVGLGQLPSSAAISAGGQTPQSISTASWAAVPATTVSAPGATGALSLTFGVLAGPRYLTVTNTGTADLSQSRYSVRYSVTAAGLSVGYVALSACVGAGATWNEVTNVCVGGAVQQLTTTQLAGSASAIVPAAAGSSIRLQAITVGVSVAVTATVSVAVTCS